MISRFFTKSIAGSLAALLLSIGFYVGSSVSASAEIRTLSLYFTHTRESLTVTYKKDGRYISSAMKELNWFFRDWRNNKATKMDPVTIDLLWELHKDLGAVKPAHIVSAFRSQKTNSMLRRMGRRVARHSQHTKGKAIDVYFPDVSTRRLRGSALARRIGGVGYYPRSGKHGFAHIDSGSVRHWPRMSRSRLASVIKRYRPTIGARLRRQAAPVTLVASARKKNGGPINITPKGFSKKSFSKKIVAIIPLPRARPPEVAMAALAATAAETFVVPVSAPGGKQNFGSSQPLIGDQIGALLASVNLEDNTTTIVQRTNKSGKSSFAGQVQDGTTTQVPLLKPLQATYASNEFWWSGDMNKLIRRDGAPKPFLLDGEIAGEIAGEIDGELAGTQLSGEDKSALETMIAALTGKFKQVTTSPKPGTEIGIVRSGKSDLLIVNRAGKGDMVSARPSTRPMGKRYMTRSSTDKMAGNFEAILKSADQPLNFSQ